MPAVNIGGVPALEAIEHLRKKLDIPTNGWTDLLGPANAHGFVVAGANKVDLVTDMHKDILAGLENGESISSYRKRFDKTVQSHGWTYNGKRGWRTRVIYDNNLRSAQMAGRWQQMQRTKAARPYLIYMTVGDSNVRAWHKLWHNKVVHIDDPWLDTHYPPNDYGCRCYGRTANEAQLKRQGLSPSTPPPVNQVPRINTRTGEDLGFSPDGIGAGWGYNVGKAWLGPDIALGKKLAALPPSLRDQVFVATTLPLLKSLQSSWKAWLAARTSDGLPRGYAHTIGHLPASLVEVLTARGNAPINTAIVVFDRKLTHLKGIHKTADKRLPASWLEKIPVLMADYQAILIHKSTGNIIFVLKAKVDSKNARAVVSINTKHKGNASNTVKSFGVIKTNDMNMKDYELLEGKL